jgi:hypothetical protein
MQIQHLDRIIFIKMLKYIYSLASLAQFWKQNFQSGELDLRYPISELDSGPSWAS